MKSKRRGRKGKCEQEIFDALIPIVERYSGIWNKYEYSGFLSGSLDSVVNHVIYKKTKRK